VHIFSALIFDVVRWKARKGLRGERLDAGENGAIAPDWDIADAGDAAKTSDDTKTRDGAEAIAARKLLARRTGMRGETYAYWYLRRHGYVFVARNFMPRRAKGEIDLIGYDGATLAFVEVRTRTVGDGDALTALPELSVTTDKQRVVVRTARYFLAERHVGECPCRFDVLAIDSRPGIAPVVRLHKDAFSPQF
jgi:putative endonuclease